MSIALHLGNTQSQGAFPCCHDNQEQLSLVRSLAPSLHALCSRLQIPKATLPRRFTETSKSRVRYRQGLLQYVCNVSTHSCTIEKISFLTSILKCFCTTAEYTILFYYINIIWIETVGVVIVTGQTVLQPGWRQWGCRGTDDVSVSKQAELWG